MVNNYFRKNSGKELRTRMPTRFDVIRSYARKLRDLERDQDLRLINDVLSKTTREHIAQVLQVMEECSLFRKVTSDHETIWNIYAQKQKKRYSSVFGLVSPIDNDITRCYVCANFVGRYKHSHFEQGQWDFSTPREGGIHHWNISHIHSYNETKCSENFNIRICCRECIVRMGTGTPFNCAVRYEKLKSLAHKEKIRTLEEAFKGYFQWYSGNKHEVVK